MRRWFEGVRSGRVPVIGRFQAGAALPVSPRIPANGFLGVGWCDCMGVNLKPLERRLAVSALI